jgi:hypothetical protein
VTNVSPNDEEIGERQGGLVVSVCPDDYNLKPDIPKNLRMIFEL